MNIKQKLGSECRKFRIEVLKKSQLQVALKLDYSQENVSAFENGRNWSTIILLYYIYKGFDIVDFLERNWKK